MIANILTLSLEEIRTMTPIRGVIVEWRSLFWVVLVLVCFSICRGGEDKYGEKRSWRRQHSTRGVPGADGAGRDAFRLSSGYRGVSVTGSVHLMLSSSRVVAFLCVVRWTYARWTLPCISCRLVLIPRPYKQWTLNAKMNYALHFCRLVLSPRSP